MPAPKRKKNWKKRKIVRSGKPRLPGAREPNGRLSRRAMHVAARKQMTEEEIKSVAIEARKRHTGLPEELVDISNAGRPNVGTVHGLMYLRREINKDQWRAAEWYLKQRRQYLSSILAKGEGAGPASSVHEKKDREAYEEFCREAGEQWDKILDCLQEVTNICRSPVYAALEYILARNLQLDHMVGDLRIGLNALHKKFLSIVPKSVDSPTRLEYPSFVS